MSHDLPPYDLGMTADDAAARFDALQRKLVPLWTSIKAMSDDAQTIVVVPSLSVDVALRPSEIQAYEERFLFLLLLLRQPRARLIYVTSQPVHPDVVDYYLGLLPGIIASHARRRLKLVTPMDGSSRPLSLKLLERPHLIAHLRGLIPDLDRCHLVPFNTTLIERDLALALGIPMYGADPRHFVHGTKSGGRKVFADAGVPHPLGIEDLAGEADVVAAIADMRARRPAMRQVIVKLNEGVSGEGNAVVDLDGLPPAGTPDARAAVAERVRAMRFESPAVAYPAFMAKLTANGGIAEERIVGDDLRSPSTQLRVTPLGTVERLSTHDQLLGGESGQSYLGCRFPADPGYAADIMRLGARVGDVLAADGVLGRFAVDFVVVRRPDGGWDAYAIEINLRKGGTTHPFLTLQFLTDGTYDADAGAFTTQRGTRKCFVASDHVESPLYRAFTPDDVFDIAVRHGIHYDHARQSGVVFHMLCAMGDCGRLGMTAVGDSPADADAIFARAEALLASEARSALARA
ncbi:hypothetical protein DCC79_01855 [bacterium]|nr:hypothetical protein [Chloroflexi bacterium CFX6]RIL12339.1 MAG: hypothetical protein DCC79_01855 [bacterium]